MTYALALVAMLLSSKPEVVIIRCDRPVKVHVEGNGRATPVKDANEFVWRVVRKDEDAKIEVQAYEGMAHCSSMTEETFKRIR